MKEQPRSGCPRIAAEPIDVLLNGWPIYIITYAKKVFRSGMGAAKQIMAR